MRVKLLIVAAFLGGMLLSGHPVVAQQVARIYGTVSGNPIALLANSSGVLRVQCE